MDSLGLFVHFTLLALRDKIPPSSYGARYICSSIVTGTFDDLQERMQCPGE